MNRRGFLGVFSAGVAGIALEQAIPLGRVWSFPKKIVIATPEEAALQTLNLVIDERNAKQTFITLEALYILKRNLVFADQFGDWEKECRQRMIVNHRPIRVSRQSARP